MFIKPRQHTLKTPTCKLFVSIVFNTETDPQCVLFLRGFYTITLLCLFTVCFVPWVRRADEQILWNSLLSTLFFITGICVSVPCTYLMQCCNADSKMLGWQTMALPELVCDYENSNKIKTMSELFIRVLLTLGFIYGMIS